MRRQLGLRLLPDATHRGVGLCYPTNNLPQEVSVVRDSWRYNMHWKLKLAEAYQRVSLLYETLVFIRVIFCYLRSRIYPVSCDMKNNTHRVICSNNHIWWFEAPDSWDRIVRGAEYEQNTWQGKIHGCRCWLSVEAALWTTSFLLSLMTTTHTWFSWSIMPRAGNASLPASSLNLHTCSSWRYPLFDRAW